MTEFMIGTVAGAIWMFAGVIVGTWLTRSSGEYERRALEQCLPFAVELVNGEIKARERSDIQRGA